MIPRTIHYCWFGQAPIPANLQKFMDSWTEHCPDFQIRRWDEESFDVSAHPFTSSAYSTKMYSHVSDFVRAHALMTEGGVYLDTDVELKGSLAPFLAHRAFSGFEAPGLPFTAVWGSEPQHPWPTRVVESYDRSFRRGEPPNTVAVSRLLETDFGIDASRDAFQFGTEGIAIYPSTRLCLDLPENTATHHFSGSWVASGSHVPYKQFLHTEHARRVVMRAYAGSDELLLAHVLRDMGAKRAMRACRSIALKMLQRAAGRARPR